MSIGRDTGYNLAAAIAPGVFTLGVVPFYIPIIGAQRFGVLAICWTLVSALRFASLGMGPALTYRLAMMKDGREDSGSSLVWTALSFAIATSLAGAALIVGIGELYFRYAFHTASSLALEINHSLPLLGALLPLTIITGVLNGALQGIHRFGALSVINIIAAALAALTPLVAASLIGVELNVLILATVAANIVVVAIEFVVCAKLLPLRRPRRSKGSDIQSLLRYGAWMSGTALIAPLVILLDRFVIGALRGPTAVAAYVLPYNLIQQLLFFPASLTSAVLPRLATLSDEEVQTIQSSSLVWLNGLLTPLSVLAIALAAPFLHLWIGPSLAEVASPVAAILLVGAWAHGIGHVPSTVVVGRSRPDILTKLLLAYLVPYMGTLYFATLQFGVIGAAAAWTIRAGFDPILFLYTRPRASDMRRLGVSAGLVISASAIALTFSWTRILYWALMLVISGAVLLQNWQILTAAIRNLRRIGFGDRSLTGRPPCVS